MESQELHQGHWCSIGQLNDQLSQVSLQLILPLCECEISLRVGFVSDLGRQRWYLQAFCLEVGQEDVMQIDEVRVALVDDPLVRSLLKAARLVVLGLK